MQYILSEKEYQELKKKQVLDFDVEKNKLQKLCTKIANTMPVFYWKRKEASIWGCILNDNEYNNENSNWLDEDDVPRGVEITMTPGYCDECPVIDICPNEYKKYSK